MATIIATTSLDLSEEKEQIVINALSECISTVCPIYSLYYIPVKSKYCAGDAIDQITFFVYVPPSFDVDRRRKLIQILHETMNQVVGDRGKMKNIVIFKYHDDEDVGVDGVLRADAKAAVKQ